MIADHGEDSPVRPTPEATDPADLPAEFEALLAEQVALARSGDLDGASSLVAQGDDLLRRFSAEGLSGMSEVAIDRIRSLHKELCLIVALAKQKSADRLRLSRRGKRSLRAYGAFKASQ